MKRALLAAALLASASARADVWQQATAPASASVIKEAYEAALRKGDEHVLQANARNGSRSEMKRQISLALEAYRSAAATRPTAAEPHFRIAAVLYSFYLDNCFDSPFFQRSPLRDCDRPDLINAAVAKDTIAAWDAAEERAPLDPRFSAGAGENVLFSRALLHTKLNTRESLIAAARDYERYIERSDGSADNLDNAVSNLAETYMMLGRIEDAINAYREAAERRGGAADISTLYGLAVALDRGDRFSTARRLIVQQGEQGYEAFRHKVDLGISFYVPQGEVYYYYALAAESLGYTERAIDYWREYIRSGAHPQYQPRAKEHIDALIAKRRATGRPAPPRDPMWDQR
ncbi:MAG: hypothetical protein ACTHU0_00240 [Kofleriaceae bacterium]